ncbi:MAG: alpha/beta fold hydrolase [Armatimonadetes bacterium]|nr:alpha/beta fold hydrolase [Armatimonadota bacterium]
MAQRNLDLQRWVEYVYEHRPRRLSFADRKSEELPQWQAELRAKVVELMHGWPEEVPLEPEVTEEHDDGQYIRQRVLLQSEPMMAVPAWLLLPKDLQPTERRPALLALHGHGRGKDDVVGLDHGDPDRRRGIEQHNYDYARQFALRGYVVLAPDQRNFGERRYQLDYLGHRDPCNIMMLKTELLGRNMLLSNIWDARKCLDYLQTLDFVDPQRLGAVGLSYGGTMALWVAALDERVAAACVSCYINTFAGYAIKMDNTCGVQTPPRLLEYIDEMWEIAALIAPRPLLIENGREDGGFPIAEALSQHEKIREVYEQIGAGERLEVDVFDGPHQFSGRKAFSFFARWLDWRE